MTDTEFEDRLAGLVNVIKELLQNVHAAKFWELNVCATSITKLFRDNHLDDHDFRICLRKYGMEYVWSTNRDIINYCTMLLLVHDYVLDKDKYSTWFYETARTFRAIVERENLQKFGAIQNIPLFLNDHFANFTNPAKRKNSFIVIQIKDALDEVIEHLVTKKLLEPAEAKKLKKETTQAARKTNFEAVMKEKNMRFKSPEIQCMKAFETKLEKFAEVVEKQFVDKNRKAVRFTCEAKYVLEDVHKNVNEAFSQYLDSNSSKKEIETIRQLLSSSECLPSDADIFNTMYDKLKPCVSRIAKIVEGLDKPHDESIIKGLEYELPRKLRELVNDSRSLAKHLRDLYADSEKAKAALKSKIDQQHQCWNRREAKTKLHIWSGPRDANFLIKDNHVLFRCKEKKKDLRLRNESRTHKILFLFAAKNPLPANDIRDICKSGTRPSDIEKYANKLLSEKLVKLGFNDAKDVRFIKYDSKSRCYGLLPKYNIESNE
ncbi:MAG: hypothetical protein ABSB11_04655 [Sedimentisphaerales bacterium]|jgi:hypothetical protein